jgi:hypothetical protein
VGEPAPFFAFWRLACYCAQLGPLKECEDWFKKAIAIDEQSVNRAAIDNPNLKPLWDSMSGVAEIRWIAECCSAKKIFAGVDQTDRCFSNGYAEKGTILCPWRSFSGPKISSTNSGDLFPRKPLSWATGDSGLSPSTPAAGSLRRFSSLKNVCCELMKRCTQDKVYSEKSNTWSDSSRKIGSRLSPAPEQINKTQLGARTCDCSAVLLTVATLCACNDGSFATLRTPPRVDSNFLRRNPRDCNARLICQYQDPFSGPRAIEPRPDRTRRHVSAPPRGPVYVAGS